MITKGYVDREGLEQRHEVRVQPVEILLFVIRILVKVTIMITLPLSVNPREGDMVCIKKKKKKTGLFP